MRSYHIFILSIVVFCLSSEYSNGSSFTLSDEGLLALDWNNQNLFLPNRNVTIVEKRDSSGPGVQFDIFYPSNDDSPGEDNTTLHWVSSKWAGNGTLTGIDISVYDAFELQFTLLTINGQSTTESGVNLIVGSMIGPSDSGTAYKYKPETISLSSSRPASIISKTLFTTDTLDMVGFTAHIPDWWSTNNWDPSGSLVTLLVEPVPGAFPIPEPATLSLLALGCLTRRRNRIT